jgi:hypothetical protein
MLFSRKGWSAVARLERFNSPFFDRRRYPKAAGIMTIKLSLKELGNPLHVSSAILTIQADISAIAALRARIAQGKRVYIATQPECIQLTSSPMLTVVTGYGISFE